MHKPEQLYFEIFSEITLQLAYLTKSLSSTFLLRLSKKLALSLRCDVFIKLIFANQIKNFRKKNYTTKKDIDSFKKKK